MQTAEPVIQLNLPVTDINFILGLVGKQPYEQVVGLIDNVRAQAAPQLVAHAQAVQAAAQQQAAPAPAGETPAAPAETSGQDGGQFQ